MEIEIKEKLKELEESHKVKILYACESGSRAWGFASPDSDYDVRFIYAHAKDWYMSIDDKVDVIELPVNKILDIGGWEIRKALRLFRKSNAPLYEWLQSPIHYFINTEFYNKLWDLSSHYFSFRAGMHHYLSMTKNCLENELQGKEVKLKKYFYALRPILAAKWIADKRQIPPMEFSKLRILISDKNVNSEIEILLEKKKASDEKEMINKIELLNEFISGALIQYQTLSDDIEKTSVTTERLDQLFRNTIDGI
jgi:predicted nucleotidyltransferase